MVVIWDPAAIRGNTIYLIDLLDFCSQKSFIPDKKSSPGRNRSYFWQLQSITLKFNLDLLKLRYVITFPIFICEYWPETCLSCLPHGFDKIRAIKSGYNQIKAPLRNIFNTSIQHGVFPVKVTLILKSVMEEVMTNYEAISAIF